MEPEVGLAPSDAVELSPARAVADAVLFEGYLLYPYRASSSKNQVRWQFGVLFPRDWAEVQPSEAWSTQTEILLEPRDDARLHLVVRCLQLQSRTVQEAVGDDFRSVPSMTVDGTQLLTWDEGTVQEVGTTVAVADLAAGEQVFPFELPAERLVERFVTALAGWSDASCANGSRWTGRCGFSPSGCRFRTTSSSSDCTSRT